MPRKISAVCASLIVMIFMSVSVRAGMPEEEIIIRAVASSWPDAEFGAKTAICAVIMNRVGAEGFGDSAAAVIRAENSGFDPSLLCEPIEEKNRRITHDACMAAMAGADPTGGLLYFEKLPEPERSDNRVEFEAEMDLGKYRAVIGGFGFW